MVLAGDLVPAGTALVTPVLDDTVFSNEFPTAGIFKRYKGRSSTVHLTVKEVGA